MRNIYITLLIGICFLGCDVKNKKINEEQKGKDVREEIQTTMETMKLDTIYNLAYQENYKVDKIKKVMKKANNAFVLLDPFDEMDQHVKKLKANNNQIIGYISVGTGEDWRDDFSDLKPYLAKKVWDEWEGEYFVTETTTGILDIMKKRIDQMHKWGLDWVEFDNMDWFEDDHVSKKLKVNKKDAQNYVNSLCDHVHSKGMKCMAKNTVKGFDNFDGVLYESFSDNKNWWDTKGTKRFLDAGKPVIINHYKEKSCDKAYNEYKSYYDNEQILFICEDVKSKKYKHFKLSK